ncbi:hypothetical protein MBOT_00770 [Mycobacterium botniense]|uniref:Transcriptional regulator WhiB n=1 Tax=Mycobacterium botniense TaxID=84962 RepID=A0A7I9XRT3_9MYCO|nr:hypothetical protein MBOT_00770 [Mycobacterium botniense]
MTTIAGLIIHLDEQRWMLDALCTETDPEIFFPDKGGSVRDAKKICRRCDVRAECLDYALANGERFGVWGGLSERERRPMHRRARRIAPGRHGGWRPGAFGRDETRDETPRPHPNMPPRNKTRPTAKPDTKNPHHSIGGAA